MGTTHTFADSFLYEQCDVPPGKSLREWRSASVAATARRRRPSVIARLHLAHPQRLTPAR
jgi:hypothetical protein